MRYEIAEMDGLWVIFKDKRMVCAYESYKEAKEAVKRMRMEEHK